MSARQDRYGDYSDAELTTAAQWLGNQGRRPWMARFKFDGDEVRGDLRGVPPIVRQMLREQFSALELMTADQVRKYLDAAIEDRGALIDQVLTEAGL